MELCLDRRVEGIRVVSLVGPAGIGKKALAEFLKEYCNRRSLFPGGVVTVDPIALDCLAAVQSNPGSGRRLCVVKSGAADARVTGSFVARMCGIVPADIVFLTTSREKLPGEIARACFSHVLFALLLN
jgi:hypothetical protein